MFYLKGNRLENIDNSFYPWTVEAELINCSNPNASIIFQKKAILAANGTVNFENLGISEFTDSCRLRFQLELPVGVNS